MKIKENVVFTNIDTLFLNFGKTDYLKQFRFSIQKALSQNTKK